jgi:hypothetical protein
MVVAHSAGTLHGDRLPTPQSSDERLKAKLGPVGYAHALDALR